MKEQAMSDTQPKTLPVAKLRNARWNTHHASQRDDLDYVGLIASLKANGMLHRIVVRPIEDGGESVYEIVDGHRRVEAAIAIGWKEVPCEIHFGLADEDAQTMTATANLQRLDNDPLLEAELIERLWNAGKTYAQIAAVLGKDERYVARRARLVNLTERWRALFGQVDATADTMEFVAAHERDLQDEVFAQLKLDDGVGYFDEDDIERAFRNNLRRLDDETGFDIKEAGCITCPWNTANHGWLFPAEEDEECKGRCENAGCFAKKWNAATDAEIEALRKKKVAVKEVKAKWDIPHYWAATKHKTRKNTVPYVYTEDGIRRIVWNEPKQAPASAAPAKTDEEKAEEKRVKAAVKTWKTNRSSAYRKLREGINRDEAKVAKMADAMVRSERWLEERRKDIVGLWTLSYAYDGACQSVLNALSPETLAELGIEALTEDEVTAVRSEDPSRECNADNGEEA